MHCEECSFFEHLPSNFSSSPHYFQQDGLLARKLNQTSEFGGLIDMLTDRLSTLGLLYVLSGDYQPQDLEFGFPVFRLTFLTLIALDIASHWSQMFSTAILGAHHKGDGANAGRNFIVRLYYGNYFFFGYLCVATEILYIVAYAFQFTEGMSCHQLLQGILWVSFPGCLLKQLVNLMQLFSACYAVAQKDAKSKIK
mmetsp:Transcript_35067/g.84908  ORF Transcript_35067/g.84908 Transcript_35067/m.84908 type:complete len:196 (+) Transcript_35067:2575-3162(+)